jgi:hypothetical protein
VQRSVGVCHHSPLSRNVSVAAFMLKELFSLSYANRDSTSLVPVTLANLASNKNLFILLSSPMQNVARISDRSPESTHTFENSFL